MLGLTIEQVINQVMGGRHIVMLGAGAGIASTPLSEVYNFGCAMNIVFNYLRYAVYNAKPALAIEADTGL